MSGNFIIKENIEKEKFPIIISLPHSGDNYYSEFIKSSLLDKDELCRAEDSFVDEIWDFSINEGYCYIKSTIPRIYVDLNRHPLELDPYLCSSDIPKFEQSKSLKVLSGIGVIPKVSNYGNDIYAEPLSREEIRKRLISYYFPYHRALKYMIKRLKNKFKDVLVIDCHSMPSSDVPKKSTFVDINLGNNYGLSISENIFNLIRSNFEKLGFIVEENIPYSGGFITQFYGNPSDGIHVLQLEINRSIFMDEKLFKKNRNIEQISKKIRKATKSILLKL